MSFSINSRFVTNFKLGDNIVYNIELLGLLYINYSKETPKNRDYFRKSMILITASCCEAVLHDFYITHAEKHDFFDANHTGNNLG